MAAALIKFTQGATTDLAGRAVEGALSSAVVASNGDNTGVTAWAWYLVDAPDGTALTLTDVDDDLNPVGSPAATTSTFTFTPDVRGTYQVLLIVNGVRALFDVRDFVVAEASGKRIPALRSDPDTYNLGGNKRAIRRDVNAILRQAAAGVSAPTEVVNSTGGTRPALADLRAQVVIHKATTATTYPLPTGPSNGDYVDVLRHSTGTGSITLDGGAINISDGKTMASSFGPSLSLIAIRATYYSADNVWRLS